MKFGYAQVSTIDQNLSLQPGALRSKTCDEYISEKISNGHKMRPQCEVFLQKLGSIDTTSSIGKLFTTVMAIIAEFKRDFIRQRRKYNSR